MKKSGFLFVGIVSILCIWASAAFSIGQIRPLSGESLLKALRQLQGIEDQPSYEQRASQEQTPSKKQAVSEANVPIAPIGKTTVLKPAQNETVLKAEQLKKETAKVETKQPVVPPPPVQPRVSAGSDKILSLIPSDSVAVLRINNLDNSLGQLDQYLGGILPIPGGLLMLARMQLAQVFGSPDLQGIDTAGSFAVYVNAEQIQKVINSQDINQMPLSVLMPVKNYNQFTGKNSNVGKPDSKGISLVSIGPNPLLSSKQVENFALLASPNQINSLTSPSADKSIIGNLDSAVSKQSATDSVWLFVNFQQLQKILAGLPIPQNLPITISNNQAGQISSEELLKTLSDVQYLSISLSPQPNVIKISATVSAKVGSPIAQSLKTDSPAVSEFVKQVGALKPADAGAKLTEVSKFLPTAKNADLIGTYNLLKPLETQAAGTQPAGQKPVMKAASSLSYAIKFGDGKITADIALPKEHLTEIMPLMMSLPFLGQPTIESGNIDINSLDISIFKDNTNLLKDTGLQMNKIAFEKDNRILLAEPGRDDVPQKYINSSGRYGLPLSVRLPQEIFNVGNCKLTKLTGDNNQNLLPVQEFEKRLFMPELQEDKRTIEFKALFPFPGNKIQTIKELEGTIEYFIASETEKVETGIIDFKKGTKIDSVGGNISSVQENPLAGIKETSISFDFTMPQRSVQSVTFYTQDGKLIKSGKVMWNLSSFGDNILTSITYSVEGGLPPKGKVAFEVGKDIKGHIATFNVSNIPLKIEGK